MDLILLPFLALSVAFDHADCENNDTSDSAEDADNDTDGLASTVILFNIVSTLLFPTGLFSCFGCSSICFFLSLLIYSQLASYVKPDDAH